MKSYLKNFFQEARCTCSHQDGLFIPVRQLSLLVAFLIAVTGLSFFGGYFLGKKHVVDDFVDRIEQDSFADQIYSSLCLLSDQDPDELRATAEEATITPVVAQSEPVTHEVQHVSQNVELVENAVAASPVPGTSADIQKYYAQLIGFGSLQAAEQFVKRMHKKSIDLEIKERESYTARGARRVWYQVVTPCFEDRDVLAKLVDRISKEEKILGVRTVAA